MNSLVVLRHVNRQYPTGDTSLFALRDISLEIARGEFVAIVGPSGSGKSTLLGLLAGIDRPSEGEVWVSAERIDQKREDALARWRRATVGIVFQFFQLLPTLTALENILLPMSLRGAVDRARAVALLTEVGLGQRLDHLPSELSGGEQQRVAIARALANDPPLLLADEPTGNLDQETGQGIMALLAMLPARGVTVVLVTHDLTLAALADRRLHMADGRLVLDERDDRQPSATAGSSIRQ